MKMASDLKATSFAALALAFASIGDAFLYPYLPVNFTDVGIPVVWVGLLLSINRFVRIIANSLIVRAFSKYGLRVITLFAVSLAITSTLGYGIATGLITWLAFRVVWGISFSAMRIGAIGYALKSERRGLALGISRSLHETGPMLALFMAPVLLHNFDPRTMFFLLGLCSVPSLYFAWRLPVAKDKMYPLEAKPFLHWPSTLNSLTFVSAILIDGIIVVVLGVLFLHYRNDISLTTATSLAAFYLGYRRICLVVFSPASGWVADRIGLDHVFNISMVFVLLGLLLIISGWIGTGAVILFAFYSINAAITPGSVSKGNIHSLAAVAENATWRDLGAAIGTLLGGLIISSTYLNLVLITGIFGLAFVLSLHFGAPRKALKLFYLWK